jgi:alanyl-tRNA synthetase
MKLLEKQIDSNPGEILSGEFVFKLYDTYGFPVDLTADIAKVNDLEIDKLGFDQAMNRQKQRSKAGGRFSQSEVKKIDHQLQTEFLGYGQLENSSKVIGIIKDEMTDEIVEGESGQIILEKTSFYAESGGQVGDTGTIQSSNGIFEVTDTQHSGNAHIHLGTMAQGSISMNEDVNTAINPIRRRAITFNHTATHLMHAALIGVLGNHVTQRGSLVEDQRLRFDFAHHQAVNTEEIREVEAIVNNKIEEHIEVETSIMKYDEAIGSGAVGLFGEKYGEKVRVLNVGSFSNELCGGTHVTNTDEIGLFKIVSESSIASGTRRIEAITGDAALKWAEETEYLVEKLADILQTSREEIELKVQTLMENNRKMNLEIRDLKAQIAQLPSDNSQMAIETINGLSVFIKELDRDSEMSVMRSAIDQMKQNIGSGVIILASVSSKNKARIAVGVTEDLITKIQADVLAQHMSEILGGKGGGRANFANAGGPNVDNLHKSFDVARDWIKNL